MHINENYTADEKAAIVQKVLHDLPEWYGLPESTHAYIDQARELPLYAAVNDNEDVLGFVTVKETGPSVAEIHCMGVLKSYHGKGIGTLLIKHLEDAIQGKYHYIQVKTVAEGHYDEYDATNRFYRSVGLLNWKFFRRYGMNGIRAW